MDVREVFVAGGGRPGISGMTRLAMSRLLGPVGRLLSGRIWIRTRLRLGLGGRGLFRRWRRYDRRGLCVARRRVRVLWRRGGHDIGGRLWRLAGRHLRRGDIFRGRRVARLSSGFLRFGVAEVLGGDASRWRWFELR